MTVHCTLPPVIYRVQREINGSVELLIRAPARVHAGCALATEQHGQRGLEYATQDRRHTSQSIVHPAGKMPVRREQAF